MSDLRRYWEICRITHHRDDHAEAHGENDLHVLKLPVCRRSLRHTAHPPLPPLRGEHVRHAGPSERVPPPSLPLSLYYRFTHTIIQTLVLPLLPPNYLRQQPTNNRLVSCSCLGYFVPPQARVRCLALSFENNFKSTPSNTGHYKRLRHSARQHMSSHSSTRLETIHCLTLQILLTLHLLTIIHFKD
uniref:Uncharacterized protein n=1 Tax=Mesocestoides corti TaxID=53468 RepID=A0A5K3F762_MESCO